MYDVEKFNGEMDCASLRNDWNDLRVVAGVDVDPTGFTLLAILRNEMYFLQEFLTHYRKLGIERFVFLNDRSDDGSREFLLQQSDTVVVESDRAYGDTIEMPENCSGETVEHRTIHLWRGMLHDMFAQDRWALQVDLDEFVHLPNGMTFQDLVTRLERQHARVVWGVMLDVYPKDITLFTDLENTARLNVSEIWHFDGERHLRLCQDNTPRLVYPGARARLYKAYGIDKMYRGHGVRLDSPTYQKLKRIIPGAKVRGYNDIWKSILIKWNERDFFKNSHSTSLPASTEYLLPIQHFRFAGSLMRKVRLGILDQSYHRNSFDHRLLAELIREMKATGGSFLYPNSRQIGSFGKFSETGNAIGFDN